jgi:hypothetical protein
MALKRAQIAIKRIVHVEHDDIATHGKLAGCATSVLPQSHFPLCCCC